MITFKITFLLSFNGVPSLKVVKEKKPAKNNAKGKTNQGKKTQPVVDEDIPKKDYQIEVGDFLNYVKVDYELIPGKFKYNLEIVCWKNIAKVSCNDGYRYYKTVKFNDIVWVPCTIHHFVRKMTDDELLNLHSHVIRFNVSYMKKDNVPKISPVYCLEAEKNSEEFVECFEDDPNEEPFVDNDEAELNEARDKCLSTDTTTSWLKFIGITHGRMVYRTIKSHEKGAQFIYTEFNSSSELFVSEKTAKKGKTKEEKKKDPYFLAPGEVFFTKSDAITFKMKRNDASITNGFVFLSVRHLLTDEQKVTLNPFIVKIEALRQLPVDVLRNHGFSKVFISFEIPDIVQYESIPKTVEHNVYFQDYHAYFMKEAPTLKSLEFIRSHRLKVEIRGIKSGGTTIEPLLFGTKNTDSNFSRRLQPREASEILNDLSEPPKDILLAVANYDLSPLLKNLFAVTEEALCHYPDNLLYGKQDILHSRCMDITTMSEMNLEVIQWKKSTSPLMEDVLASACTNLSMEFRILAPQNMIYHSILLDSKTFKRMFLHVINRSVAEEVMATISLHNEKILGLDAMIINPIHFVEDRVKLSVKKPMTRRQKLAALALEDEIKPKMWSIDDLVTGFSVDNSGSDMLIFAEGISHGFILEVWNKVHKLNPWDVRVFFNSKTDFEDRYYKDPCNLGSGIMRISLKVPLHEIFEDNHAFLEGSMPLPCYRALQKLSVILRTDSFEEMTRLGLFPNERELLDLHLELGVPLRLEH